MRSKLVNLSLFYLSFVSSVRAYLLGRNRIYHHGFTLAMASFDFGAEISYQPVSKDLESIASHLDQAKTLAVPLQRAIALIVGAAVTDAATRPFHWVYNRTVLESTIKDQITVEFWPKSVSPFYTIPTGWRSCYNDESLVMLRTLDAVKGSTCFFSLLLN